MKLSMEQAAYVIGKTKKTIYNHKDRNKFSFEQDSNGKAVIDVSELLRVYGTSPEIARRLEDLQSNPTEEGRGAPYEINEKRSHKDRDTQQEYEIRIIRLEAELEKERALKEKAEIEVDYFKEALDKAQENTKRITLLLEDKTEKSETKATPDWDKAIKALKGRIENQEATAKSLKEERQRAIQQNRALKEALEQEKSKTIWQKLFGS